MHRTELLVVYDDDHGQLPMRTKLVELALDDLRPRERSYDQCEVVAMADRTELLDLIASLDRPCVCLADLAGRAGDMHGARMLRTLRRHPRLAARCLPVALTAHNTAGVLEMLDGLAFAVVQSTTTSVVEDIARALADAVPVLPTTFGPCRAYPPTTGFAAWDRALSEDFQRSFGVERRLGDDLILANIKRRVPDTVTDQQLQELGSSARASVRSFKRAVEGARGIAYADIDALVAGFVQRIMRWTADDRLTVLGVEAAARGLSIPEVRSASYLTDDVLEHVAAFVGSYRSAVAEIPTANVARRQRELERLLDDALGDPERRSEVVHGALTLQDVLIGPAPRALAR